MEQSQHSTKGVPNTLQANNDGTNKINLAIISQLFLSVSTGLDSLFFFSFS